MTNFINDCFLFSRTLKYFHPAQNQLQEVHGKIKKSVIWKFSYVSLVKEGLQRQLKMDNTLVS